MIHQFFMPMIPPTVTDQMHRITYNRDGKPVIYDSPELSDAKAKLIAHLSQHRISERIDGGVRLVVKWLFPITGDHKDGEYKLTKPDTDNLQKALKDCMTKVGFWKDDAQVVRETVEKRWSDDPAGIYIDIEELEVAHEK